MNTIDYYNKNAESFFSNTVSVEFGNVRKKFLSFLSKPSLILDFGCGSGRDTKAFLEDGYLVEAIDGSAELCRYASAYTGIKVKQMLFQDWQEKERYDGIWACSSLLHLPYEEMPFVMKKMTAALKQDGIIYASFKLGRFEGMRNGRYFTDLTEESCSKLLCLVEGLRRKEQWVTSDVRPERGKEQWLNLILQKK